MLSLRVSDMVAASVGPATAGCIGVYFSAAGTIQVVTRSGGAISITGDVGTSIECPIASFANLGTATVLQVIGR